MIRRLLLAAIALAGSISISFTAHADNSPGLRVESDGTTWQMIKPIDRMTAGVFDRMEVGLNIGTTGLGLEIGTHITPWVRVRAGVDWVPRFNIPMNFDLMTYTEGESGILNSGKFDRIQELMDEFTGFEIDQQVTMNSRPTMTTFRFMADVYPFAGKGWRATVGFFAGGRTVGRTINAMHEMPSLLTVGIYNRLYDYAAETDIFDFKLPFGDEVYLDPDVAQQLKDKFEEYGRLGIHIGDYKDGTPYIMEPDKDGTVSARALVNAVRPYVGIGYDGAISRDGRWKIGFDLGAQFWGGAPKVVIHDGTVMNDLINVRGKVGDYLSLIKGLPVYPTANFKISYTFF